MARNEEYLRKHIKTVKKFGRAPGAITQMIKLFNNLCPQCQHKVRRKPTMGLDAYCPQCRPLVIARTEKARGKLK